MRLTLKAFARSLQAKHFCGTRGQMPLACEGEAPHLMQKDNVQWMTGSHWLTSMIGLDGES